MFRKTWSVAVVVPSVLVLCLAGSGICRAGILHTSGDVSVISPPPSVELGALESDHLIFAFAEQEDLVLPAAVDVDIIVPGTVRAEGELTPGSLPAGTLVDSWFVHFDPIGAPGLTPAMGSIIFDQEILGLIVLGDELDASDAVLGSPTTTYPTGFAGRRVDLFNEDSVNLSADRRSITVLLQAGGGLDSLRVITAVPEPSALILLAAGGVGLLAFAWRRRRRTAVAMIAVVFSVVGVGVGNAMTVPVGPVIAETGFNDASGINHDGVTHSPYKLGLPLLGQPPIEPGWAGPWTRESSHLGATMAQSDVTFEGDGAGLFQRTSNTSRRWTEPQTGQFVVECQMRFTPNAQTVVYVYGSGLSPGIAGTTFVVRNDGSIDVRDGVGDGSSAYTFEDTGFTWAPDRWYKFTQIVDYEDKTWRFFMDDVEYIGPDVLGFRGTPPPMDGINILSEVSGNGTYMDDLRISAIPEPGAIASLACGLAGLLAFASRRRIYWKKR